VVQAAVRRGAVGGHWICFRSHPWETRRCSAVLGAVDFSWILSNLNMTQIYSDNLHTSANTFNTAYNFFRSVNVYDVCHVSWTSGRVAYPWRFRWFLDHMGGSPTWWWQPQRAAAALGTSEKRCVEPRQVREEIGMISNWRMAQVVLTCFKNGNCWNMEWVMHWNKQCWYQVGFHFFSGHPLCCTLCCWGGRHWCRHKLAQYPQREANAEIQDAIVADRCSCVGERISSKLIGHLEGYLCTLRLPVQKW